MDLEEAIKVLKEVQENCKAERVPKAIAKVIMELDKRGFIIRNILDVFVEEGILKKSKKEDQK